MQVLLELAAGLWSAAGALVRTAAVDRHAQLGTSAAASLGCVRRNTVLAELPAKLPVGLPAIRAEELVREAELRQRLGQTKRQELRQKKQKAEAQRWGECYISAVPVELHSTTLLGTGNKHLAGQGQWRMRHAADTAVADAPAPG